MTKIKLKAFAYIYNCIEDYKYSVKLYDVKAQKLLKIISIIQDQSNQLFKKEHKKCQIR